MGKKAVKQYINIIILVISIILLIFTIIGIYGGNVNPTGHYLRAMTTLALPFILLCNFVVLIYWAIRRSYIAAIPVLALIVSFGYIGTIFQFGGKPDNTNENFTIASYNVRAFNQDGTGVVASDVFASLQKEEADIVCLQEYNYTMSGSQRTVHDIVADTYPYVSHCNNLIILSRFPIKKHKEIPFEYSNNSGMWADVQVDPKHRVRVYNVHMETTGINSTLHHAAKEQAAQNSNQELPEVQINTNVANSILDNYKFNSSVRAGQAIIIANDKRDSKYPIILCGDFNDVPYSFTYQTLLGDLKDGFKEGGHGFGATYRGAKGLFRIDYIFHSDKMQSLDYYTVDQDYSDHNPVYSKIAFKDE